MNELSKAFQARLDFDDAGAKPRYNVAPTQTVAVVRQSGDEREMVQLRWGLIPSWAKDLKIGNQTINARGDTVAEKPAFRAAFKKRRCLIPVDGFYEWHKLGKAKQPYFIHREDDMPFAFAGLWETWHGGPGKSDEPLESFTIITTEANDLMRPLHDRMPVILDPVDFDVWIDPGLSDRERLEKLIVPYEGDGLVATPVSTYVNNVRNQDEQCVTPTG